MSGLAEASISDDKRAAAAPAWFPAWAKELAELYFSGSTCLFIIHGNVHDLFRCPGEDGRDHYQSLPEFLATQLFGSWDIVLGYDLGNGLKAMAGASQPRLQEMMKQAAALVGGPQSWPRDPDQALDLLERLIQRNLLAESPPARKSVALVFPHSQYLLPSADLAMLARGQAARLVRLMGWAQNPYVKRVNMAFCLIADKLTEVNQRLVANPHVAAVEVSMPSAGERREFIEHAAAGDAGRLGEFTPHSLSQVSSGLDLVSLNVVLSRSGRGSRPLELSQFKRLKKRIIERQCQGLVEFVEPSHTLELVVGHEAGKARLRQDAQWIAQGRLASAPMGYLFCGPVGTGKTFLAECYAGSIGIPCVKLRNFRSKYVGETEGNLERVLTVLRSLGPVVVIVDEADAALGDRQSDGDSGTSARVFSMIAMQMGDTRYRGKIIWMLLTARPDLLPIDLKRQGRAEVHVPLFYPHEEAEIAAMFRAMASKNDVPLAEDAVPNVPVERQLSGADIESIVLSASRAAMTADRAVVERGDLEAAAEAFIPSAQGLEKELQELAAVLECTDRGFLTPDWREKTARPDGRSRIQERLSAIRSLLE